MSFLIPVKKCLARVDSTFRYQSVRERKLRMSNRPDFLRDLPCLLTPLSHCFVVCVAASNGTRPILSPLATLEARAFEELSDFVSPPQLAHILCRQSSMDGDKAHNISKDLCHF